MDILAHLLWAFIIFPDGEYKFLALIFAVIPDITATLPHLFYIVITGKIKPFISFKKGIVPQLPKQLIELYKLLHSIPIVLIVAIIMLTFGLGITLVVYVCGSWLFHVSTDIFLHDKSYIKTPFLYPFSSITINGINWVSPKFIIANYVLIAIGLVIKFFLI